MRPRRRPPRLPPLVRSAAPLQARRLHGLPRSRRPRGRRGRRADDGVACAAVTRRRPLDVLAAGMAGAIFSGFPSTLITLLERGDPLEGGRALGKVLLPREDR